MFNTESIYRTLKSSFGYETFRDHQLEIIQHTLEGGDSLVIMPTGGGKSLCFQLPALLKEGMALVISPLISLMNDQVRALKSNGISAAALHSASSSSENKVIDQQIQNKQLKVLYISPERALASKFQDYIAKSNISLIAIDEAHCVSIWGNDFRPEYAQLTQLTALFPNVPVLALTATADKATQEDIKQQLKLRNPKSYISSFERPNIHLVVKPGVERLEQIKEFLKLHPGEPGIIYCLARKTTESIALSLHKLGYKAEAYHAELDKNIRKKVQEDFQFDRIQIVCATIAFGMGIDKPNIRWIIHYNLPKNIENYYQEIGRSGRDGQPAEALMFYSFRDVAVYREFIEKSEANETFKRVQTEKLERIWEYSQATHCRTNVILNYFGEYRMTGCGHCDLCRQPLEGFDGTTFTQMALSACKRAHESIGLHLLVDVLRGSGKKEILEKNLNKIKTYGTGRETTYRDWIHYITQMINLGYLEIDYTNHSVLKCTPLSEEVLFRDRKVTLHKPTELPQEPISLKKPKRVKYEEGLLERLENLCKLLAKEEGIPAYAIFPKGTLREMVETRPLTVQEFSTLTGVGDYKSRLYGEAFISCIRDYMTDQKVIKKPKGSTYVETLRLFKEGLTVEQIAQQRGIIPATVLQHLARLYEKGEDLPLLSLLHPDELILARQGWRASGFSDQMSKVKEQVGDSLDYGRLHIALAILKKEQITHEN